ncbi:hypothetical protein O181_061675 [Austropuccinia psidii MF-1]|uniref:Reverse transcriptase domain-containing protein n=1 Tax=Austropuccinia psidii MF-1 TaxID=1389203 RepID=A0A9Q3EMV0_9BASI|nr:hypothetical protein [Austropuccinia psidii MF-1]
MYNQDPIEEFKEGQLSANLTSKQKLSLMKILSKNRPAFSIGEEPLGKIRGNDIDLYLDVERPYPPMLRRPPYPEILERHNEIVEITTPFLITWNDGKSMLCGNFRALHSYTKGDRYHIPRISHALDKVANAKYITKMDCMKRFHQNGVKPNSMKVLRIICNLGIYEYITMPFGLKNAPDHFKRMMDTIFQEEILEG